MAIYMVQHTFARPDWEAEWNNWYANNLKVLMSVPGFRTGQRFKATEGSPPRYMAVYTVDSEDVFESRIYKDSGGGGTASQRFRPAYQIWIRNLFEGLAAAPAVGDDECLVIVNGDSAHLELPGVPLTTLKTTGFHKTTPYRGIGILKRSKIDALPKADNITVYLPITAQLGPLY